MNLSKLMRFGHDVKVEAGKIAWPTLAETRGLTIMVFILTTLIALYLVGVDMVIAGFLKLVLGV